jgi:hypothetical protein
MKKRDDENLTKTNLIKVIELLNQEKPITKKAACEILNISYNTTRLKKLIEEFISNEANNKKERAKRRGTPLTDSELNLIAQAYLEGDSLSSISEFIYRPTSLVKEGLKTLGIPERSAENDYFNPPWIEMNSMKEDYSKDDMVYAARYGEAAIIDSRIETEEGPVYNIYVLGKAQCCATQPFWELSDLSKLAELGVNIKPQVGLQPSYNPRK